MRVCIYTIYLLFQFLYSVSTATKVGPESPAKAVVGT